jgi:hypothetical protein
MERDRFEFGAVVAFDLGQGVGTVIVEYEIGTSARRFAARLPAASSTITRLRVANM